MEREKQIMRIGVMCSGNGTNFENIVRTCTKDEVVLMIHNKKKCGAASRADKLGIPHCHIRSKDEDSMIQLFQAWRVDLIVMAGWMRIVSSKLIEAFPKVIGDFALNGETKNQLLTMDVTFSYRYWDILEGQSDLPKRIIQGAFDLLANSVENKLLRKLPKVLTRL